MGVSTIALSGQTTVATVSSSTQNVASAILAVSGSAGSVSTTPTPTTSLATAISPSSTGTSTQSVAAESASLQKSAASLNQNSQPQFGSIEFSVDQQSNKMVLKVVDQETKQVLLQIPSKEALILSETIGNGGAGSLIHASA